MHSFWARIAFIAATRFHWVRPTNSGPANTGISESQSSAINAAKSLNRIQKEIVRFQMELSPDFKAHPSSIDSLFYRVVFQMT